MVPYSDWFGAWNDYWQDYIWQPLNGGHRALADCHTVIKRLQEMSGLPAVPEQPAARPAGTLDGRNAPITASAGQ